MLIVNSVPMTTTVMGTAIARLRGNPQFATVAAIAAGKAPAVVTAGF